MENKEEPKQTNGYKLNDGEEVQIPVPWGHISGKWWGSRDAQPILFLHGWQDNAGSMDGLAALLSHEHAILSIDLPGHGYSSHIPEGQFYYVFWDGVLVLRRIVKFYKWDKVKLLGHSLGGAISFLYAGTYPEEVEFMISLDIVSPSVRNIDKVTASTGDHIDKFLKYEKLTLDEVPCYEYPDMLKIVEDAYHGSITTESAKIMMKRGTQPALKSKHFYFSRDPRLKVALLGMLSMEQAMSFASRIVCPYLNIRAVPGMKFDEPEHYHTVLNKIKETSRRFRYEEVEGTHHVHLNEPEKVAPIVKSFLSSQ